jgi:hypothetical protein
MVALNGTILVVYQFCVAEHDILFSPEIILALLQNVLPMSFSTLSSLIISGILFCILWTDDLKPYLI